ncbi:MAG: squalene--hopene cyclase [Planctomycetes bacterium]|nr:squalene--hopene cyclase [Planctomycetota bacterium]
MESSRLQSAYETARAALLAERTPEGFWIGELSTSALSTATAVAALAIAGRTSQDSAEFVPLIENGLKWLAEHQNPDGGWGDTVKSFSNISTTMLCRSAFHIAGKFTADAVRRSETWLSERYGKTPEELAEAVRNRYGKDRTFSVPILTTAALAGLVSWKEVPRLPFEMACLPQSWYRFAGLPVVSYALPALIAIGQCVHHHRGTWNPVTGFLRWLGKCLSLRVLERIQPSNGGFLEAAPLTSFVVMSLASFLGVTNSNYPAQKVIAKGIDFLRQSVRPDGSWPIDTNLSIWVTTLSVNALASADDLNSLDRQDVLRDWLLAQQMKERHPYTGAAPGGWGWSHLPGSVPDCDDTPGAMLALVNLGLDRNHEALANGMRWIDGLQNRDGGFPTFCRGWGKLPFDRSGADLTAHALRAKLAMNDVDPKRGGAGCIYLQGKQRSDGSWLPLWFGNQHAPNDINPTYGTARVLAASRRIQEFDPESSYEEVPKAVAFLLSIQNADGGWGGAKDTPSSIEETALVVEVLIGYSEESRPAVERGIEYLVKRVEDGTFTDASPIGFYFAKLWYFEKLYPIIFTVGALGKALRRT